MYHDDFNSAYEHIASIAKQMFIANGKRYRSDCGSYLFSPKHSEGAMRLSDKMNHKQKLLFDAAKNASTVLEIGTYMGHSLLIMLCSNPKLKVTTVDLSNRYFGKSIEVLRNTFPEATINFIEGDSLTVMSTLHSTFDFFHLDGCHDPAVVQQEIDQCVKLFDRTKPTATIVLDDLHYVRDARDYLVTKYHVTYSQTSAGNNYNWVGIVKT